MTSFIDGGSECRDLNLPHWLNRHQCGVRHRIFVVIAGGRNEHGNVGNDDRLSIALDFDHAVFSELGKATAYRLGAQTQIARDFGPGHG